MTIPNYEEVLSNYKYFLIPDKEAQLNINPVKKINNFTSYKNTKFIKDK